MTVPHVTDIWIYTSDTLRSVAEKIGLTNIEHDCENAWEWVIGDLLGTQVDVTRSDRVSPEGTETAIFLLDPAKGPWPRALQDVVVERLQQAGYSEIWLGQLTVNRAETFDKTVLLKL